MKFLKTTGVILVSLLSFGALADTYNTAQALNAIQQATNLNVVGLVQTVDQTAVNLANTVDITDNDGFGGDTFNTFQAQNAIQVARNTNLAAAVVGDIDQVAANLANTVSITDTGGFPVFLPQTVNTIQLGNNVQVARNVNAVLVSTGAINQTAVNLSNTVDVTLPSTPSISLVNTLQLRNAAQFASNVNFAGTAGAVTQVAANLANTVKITQ